VASYLSFRYSNDPQPASAPRHQVALDKLKAKTSNQPWMTVEESLVHEFEKSRQAGRLKEAEGWDARDPETGPVMVTYSFQENEKQQKAIWLVDPFRETFIPQNDLAEFIFKP
jgi:3'-phosphoadenosine 5'-phosphosulfate (PAPS) 3'-phosphatase